MCAPYNGTTSFCLLLDVAEIWNWKHYIKPPHNHNRNCWMADKICFVVKLGDNSLAMIQLLLLGWVDNTLNSKFSIVLVNWIVTSDLEIKRNVLIDFHCWRENIVQSLGFSHINNVSVSLPQTSELRTLHQCCSWMPSYFSRSRLCHWKLKIDIIGCPIWDWHNILSTKYRVVLINELLTHVWGVLACKGTPFTWRCLLLGHLLSFTAACYMFSHATLSCIQFPIS